MKKRYVFCDKDYELIEDYKNGFEKDEVESKFTDYFSEFDYVIGDWAYGKLRMKGFFEKTNKQCSSINDFSNYQDYIKNYCAYECKYFILKKVNDAENI